jgi:hypothetical protein
MPTGNDFHTGASSTAWATAGNWSGANTPPITGDAAYLDWNSATNNIAGSDQSAVTLASLYITMLFTKYLGDLATPLKIGATVAVIGQPSLSATAGSGSGRINWDGGTAATTVTVLDGKTTSADSGLPPIRIKAVNVANVLNALGGRIGVAVNSPSDTAQFATINVANSAILELGSGLTLATLNTSGGSTTVNALVTTVNHSGGGIITYGDYTLGTVNLRAASLTANHKKTAGNGITTLNMYAGAVLDLSNNPNDFSVGTLVVNGNCTVRRNPARPTQFTQTTLTLNNGSLTIQ